MAWCPKCENEYRDGITVCVDCGTPLVASLEERDSLPVILLQTEDKEMIEKFVQYLDYSGITSYKYEADENNLVWSLYVAEKDYANAGKLYKGFAIAENEKKLEQAAFSDATQNENEDDGVTSNAVEDDTADGSDDNANASYDNAADGSDDATNASYDNATDGSDNVADSADNTVYQEFDVMDEEEIAESFGHSSSSGTYVRQSERAQEYKFSAYTCLLFGVAGTAAAILNLLDVVSFIPARFSQVILLFVFLAFFFTGIIMRFNSKTIEGSIEGEETLEKEINEWLKANVTNEYLDSLKDESASDEINYFKYFEAIKASLTKNFPDASEAMTDALIDEYLSDDEQ